jgi:hypothetical protein
LTRGNCVPTARSHMLHFPLVPWPMNATPVLRRPSRARIARDHVCHCCAVPCASQARVGCAIRKPAINDVQRRTPFDSLSQRPLNATLMLRGSSRASIARPQFCHCCTVHFTAVQVLDVLYRSLQLMLVQRHIPFDCLLSCGTCMQI